MIQQPQYTPATTKYNFPPLPSLEDTTLPQRLIELSLRSIKQTQNRAGTTTTALYQPYQTLTEETLNPTEEITPAFTGQTTLKPHTIRLKPKPSPHPVIAIDVSSIKIGETNRGGILLALRAATVWKQKGTGYRYTRFGPFPFHITEENKQEITQLFNQHSRDTQEEEGAKRCFPSSLKISSAAMPTHAPSLINIQTRMTTLLERWIQTQTTAHTSNSLILLDGSLTAGTSDTPVTVLAQLLETAHNRNNTVLAFTKTTRLRANGTALTDLIQKTPSPCLLQMDGYPLSAYPHIRFLGAIYVAKLAPNPHSCAFRLDIDNNTPPNQAIEAVEHLIGNDLVTDGYPETLRLAHIYSTFTANEVIGIQRFLAQAYHIRIEQKPNIRRILFGPYAKGPQQES